MRKGRGRVLTAAGKRIAPRIADAFAEIAAAFATLVDEVTAHPDAQVDYGDAFVTGGKNALKSCEGFTKQTLRIHEALSALTGVSFGGVEGLAVLGKEHVDVTAQLPEILRQPFRHLFDRWDTTHDGCRGIHHRCHWAQNPTGNQIACDKYASEKDESLRTEEPVEGLAHEACCANGGQPA